MERVPEPELMSDEAQARAYSDADFEGPHNRFVELFLERFPEDEVAGTALDLGCGPADITVRVAKAFPGLTTVHGVDGSGPMLAEGNKRLKREGLADKVELLEAILPKAKLPKMSYDVIFSNSLLHHLNDPLVLWEAIRQYAGVGTKVFIMDLLRPVHREEAEKLLNTYAKDEPEVLRQDFLHSLLAAYTVDEVKLQLNKAGLSRLSIQEVSDRHWIAWGQFGK